MHISKTFSNISLIAGLIIFAFALAGCNFVAKTAAKNENSGKQSEIKTDATPKPAATVNAKLFSANLIKNGDAEGGNVSGWSNSDNLKTVIYGEFGGGPYPDSPGPANRGEKYFYVNVGSDKLSVVFAQKLDVAGVGEAIDKGTVNYNLGGWFGGINGSYSTARLKISFLDATGKELSKDETAEVKESDRADEMVLIERNKSGTMPGGTRKIEIQFECYIRPGHGGEELATNAYADNLSFVLTQKQ